MLKLEGLERISIKLWELFLSWEGVNESRRHLPFQRTKMEIHLQDFGFFFFFKEDSGKHIETHLI